GHPWFREGFPSKKSFNLKGCASKFVSKMKFPRLIILFILLTTGVVTLAQTKFGTKDGQINFVSNAQLELIKASSRKLEGILDPATNQFAFRVNIRSFEGFNSSMQRDHFSENYLESEKVPTASFTGKII